MFRQEQVKNLNSKAPKSVTKSIALQGKAKLTEQEFLGIFSSKVTFVFACENPVIEC